MVFRSHILRFSFATSIYALRKARKEWLCYLLHAGVSNCGLGVGRNLFCQVGLSFSSRNLVTLRWESCQARRQFCSRLVSAHVMFQPDFPKYDSPEYGKLSRVRSRRINMYH